MSDTSKINILVVDDLPDKLLVFEFILSELGENVVTARSGEEALKQVLENDFAVILLDVNMPGMDGLETAEFIRRRKRSSHTPIIFITAYADDVHTAKGYSLGAVDYILSPVVPEILRTKVKVFADLFRMHEQVKRQAEERVALVQEQAARATAEEANRRSAFLAEASGVLSRSLEVHEILRDLTRVVIPFLADISAVSLLKDRGDVSQTWIARTDPADASVIHSSTSANAVLFAPLHEATQRVYASGKPELFTDMTTWDASPAAAESVTEEAASEDVGMQHGSVQSAMVFPLTARGYTLGALVLAAAPGRRPYEGAELSLGEDLAGRAAVAIDNARLYRTTQEADHQKDEFLAMLAHELRNPLAPICNAVEILHLHDLKPELIWVRNIIQRQVKHLVRLVDDLLDVSRITRGKIALQKQIVDVATIVANAEETSRPIIDARRHELSVSLPTYPLKLSADPDRLCQILDNLLNNAAKYTEPGGRIWLFVDREDDQAVFRISDTGIGIPSDMLPRVFDLFTQVDQSLDRHPGGLGIGLALVRRLVEMHGGTVQATSAGKGQGSEFIVRLPLPAAEITTAVPSQHLPGVSSDSSPRRILVVDDHADVAECLAMLLKDLGHEVHTACDGSSAFEAVRTFGPEVVLLDIGLPEMDGYEVARRLRAEHGPDKLLLVALTGYGQEADRRRTREAGFDEHLLKPAGGADLNRLLAQVSLNR